jgi:hypothetical protein
MEVRKTKSGSVISITHSVYGMLESGGIADREVLYKRATLTRVGIDYNADPQSYYNDCSTNLAVLLNTAVPDRVLKKGRTIQ